MFNNLINLNDFNDNDFNLIKLKIYVKFCQNTRGYINKLLKNFESKLERLAN